MTATIRITFHHMAHSHALEAYTREKLEKLFSSLHGKKMANFHADIKLHAESAHVPHHRVECHVREGAVLSHSLSVHHTGTDMYSAIDTSIGKLRTVLRKEKEKQYDDIHKRAKEKQLFFNGE